MLRPSWREKPGRSLPPNRAAGRAHKCWGEDAGPWGGGDDDDDDGGSDEVGTAMQVDQVENSELVTAGRQGGTQIEFSSFDDDDDDDDDDGDHHYCD